MTIPLKYPGLLKIFSGLEFLWLIHICNFPYLKGSDMIRFRIYFMLLCFTFVAVEMKSPLPVFLAMTMVTMITKSDL